MSIPLAVGLAAGLVNVWALIDVWRHPRHQWLHAGRSRVMWASMVLAGAACGASTAPFLAPVAVYTAIVYVGVAHPALRDGVSAA
ncbi:MAG: hypothetical protein M3394_08095 [Actinomycetota bacterium]|nr:hypothetical protein [Actinomycetota bacterium]